MAQRGSDAGDEFLHSERLGDVVVGAELQRLDDARLVGSAGKDDDRRLAAGGAPAAQEVVAGDVRQAEIEQDEVGVAGDGGFGGAAVGRLDDLVALRAEAGAQQPADRRLVVDDEDADRGGAHAA